MVPVLPDNESVTVLPGQMFVAVVVAVPTTVAGLTVTVIATLGPSQPDVFT